MKKEKISGSVVTAFKSHCVCGKIFVPGERWELYTMQSKKRALITSLSGGVYKVKLSRAITNSSTKGP